MPTYHSVDDVFVLYPRGSTNQPLFFQTVGGSLQRNVVVNIPCDRFAGRSEFTAAYVLGATGAFASLDVNGYARVDGGWTDWVDQTTCSAVCGGGTVSQMRSCTNPTPAYGGAQCSGLNTQTASCENTCVASVPVFTAQPTTLSYQLVGGGGLGEGGGG